MPRWPSLLDRLADRFTVSDGCWVWTHFTTDTGYGDVSVNGRHRRAHRVVYELLVGPIPPGTDLHHACANRLCVRPAHLHPLAHDEHAEDHAAREWRGVAAKNAAKVRCNRGHPFDSLSDRGARECSVCRRRSNRERQRRYRARRASER